MLSSDLRTVYESYQNIYEEGDGISCEMIEEVVEELIEECLEFGYSIDEATVAVENAALLYIDEAKVTYGSDTESPEQRRERAKSKVAQKRSEARKTAVKTAVGRAKEKAMGAVAGAGIAASIAKDTARRAARTATHKVSYGVQKKKAEVKSGVKSMIGRGLRKAAGAVGKVAQKAAGAASRLGEGVEQIDEVSYSAKAARAGKDIGKPGKTFAKIATEAGKRYGSEERGKKVAGAVLAKLRKEEAEVDVWDIVLEFLVSEGYAETNDEALGIMSKMDKEVIDSIIESQHARENPEKYEREQEKKYAPVRGERTPMPPRGNKRREDFEKWYAKQMGR